MQFRIFAASPLILMQRVTYLSIRAFSASASASSKWSKVSASSSSTASTIVPKTPTQKAYVRHLQALNPPVVVATGPAGCGKTLLATSVGIEQLQKGRVDRLIVTRPSVAVENEQFGFLPGSLDDKMKPWMLPILDAMRYSFKPSQIDQMIKTKTVELAPLAYMRGRTLDHAWVILDEAQNTTPQQMLMLLTRIGEGTKIVVTGDMDQHDRAFDYNGLLDLVQRIQQHRDMLQDKQEDGDVDIDERANLDWIKHIDFSNQDIQRHPIIPHILSMYQTPLSRKTSPMIS
jgi:phosphate starvation-inducible protein PhoH and related proteins